MKIYIIFLAVLFLSSPAQALDLEVWEMDDQKAEIMIDKMFAYAALSYTVKPKFIKELEGFTAFLKDDLNPYYRLIHEKALEKDHRLMDLENLPIMIPITRVYLLDLIPKLKDYENKNLGKEEMEIYAQSMNCLGYILSLDKVVRNFMRNNWEFIKDNGFEREYLGVIDRIERIKETLLKQSARYTPVFRPNS